jgi:hypothetical protein
LAQFADLLRRNNEERVLRDKIEDFLGTDFASAGSALEWGQEIRTGEILEI